MDILVVICLKIISIFLLKAGAVYRDKRSGTEVTVCPTGIDPTPFLQTVENDERVRERVKELRATYQDVKIIVARSFFSKLRNAMQVLFFFSN